MVRRLVSLHAAVAVIASMLMIGLGTAPAAARHVEIPQPFFAEVRDQCAYGWTEGRLAWKAWHAPDRPGVNVRGIVGERPLRTCIETNRRQTFVEFTAYIGRTAVDREVRRVDPRNNPTAFRLTLEQSAPVSIRRPEIDRVVVRVCREAGPLLPAFRCGDAQTYYPPRQVH